MSCVTSVRVVFISVATLFFRHAFKKKTIFLLEVRWSLALFHFPFPGLRPAPLSQCIQDLNPNEDEPSLRGRQRDDAKNLQNLSWMLFSYFWFPDDLSTDDVVSSILFMHPSLPWFPGLKLDHPSSSWFTCHFLVPLDVEYPIQDWYLLQLYLKKQTSFFTSQLPLMTMTTRSFSSAWFLLNKESDYGWDLEFTSLTGKLYTLDVSYVKLKAAVSLF